DRVQSLRLPDRSAGNRQRFSWLPWTLCFLLAFGTVYFANKARSLETSNRAIDQSADGDAKEQAKGPAKSEITLESKGYIIPISLIQVSPLVSGKVLKLNIHEGQKVKKGEIIAELGDMDYQADYDRAEAAYIELTKYREQETEQAKAELEETKAQMDQ